MITLALSSMNQYEKMTEAIQKVAEISKFILIVAGISTFVILGLLMVLSLRDRKYEIGVLLSLGENKFAAATQVVIEVLLIAVVACGFSLGTSYLVAGNLSDNLLDNQVTNLSENSQPELEGASILINGIPQQQEQTVEQIDTINVNILDLESLIDAFGLGLGIIILSTLLPAIWMMRANPKTIMLKEE